MANALEPSAVRHLSRSLDEMVERRVAFLTAYQNAAYARRYASLVEQVREREAARVPGSTALTEAVALFALLIAFLILFT